MVEAMGGIHATGTVVRAPGNRPVTIDVPLLIYDPDGGLICQVSAMAVVVLTPGQVIGQVGVHDSGIRAIEAE